MRSLFLLSAVALVFPFCAPSQAADVSIEPVLWLDRPGLVTIKLSGWIEPGDLDKVRKAYRKADREHLTIAGLELQSNGGDVETGLAIADWVRRNKRKVLVRSTCWSACSYAALTALAQDNLFIRDFAEIGVHRIKDTASGTPAPWWDDIVIDQLRRAGVSLRCLEDIAATPINSMKFYMLPTLREMGAVDLRD